MANDIKQLRQAINKATSILRKRETRLEKAGLKDTSAEMEKIKLINEYYGNKYGEIKALKLTGDEKINERRILGEYMTQLKKALADTSTTVRGIKKVIDERAKMQGKSQQQVIYEMKQDTVNTSYEFKYEHLSNQNQVDYENTNQEIADRLADYMTDDIDDIY